jgi:hypothetical protein
MMLDFSFLIEFVPAFCSHKPSSTAANAASAACRLEFITFITTCLCNTLRCNTLRILFSPLLLPLKRAILTKALVSHCMADCASRAWKILIELPNSSNLQYHLADPWNRGQIRQISSVSRETHRIVGPLVRALTEHVQDYCRELHQSE